MKSSGKKKSLNIYLGLVRLMDCVMERFLKPLTLRGLYHNDDPYDVHVEKNVKKMFSIWEDLQILNKDPIYLIALIASQFHLLFQVKCAMIKGMHDQSEIASLLSVHPYRVKLALPVCARLSVDTIMDLLHRLADLDQSIKSGKLDKKLGFEIFLLKLKG